MHGVAADDGDAGALALAAGTRRRAARHHRVRRTAASSASGAASCPRSSSTAPRGACSSRRAQLGLLDPDWTPEASVAAAARSTSTAPRTGRSPGRWRSGRSCCSTPAPRSRSRSGPAAPAPPGGRRPLRGRPAHVHGLLLLPQPRPAQPPRPRPRHRGPERRRGAAGRAPGRRVVHEPGCAVLGEDRSGFRGGGRGRPERRRLRGRSSATSPASSAGAPPARAATPKTCACPASRPSCSTSSWPRGRPSSWSSSPAARTRSASVEGRAAGLVQAFMPGEEGGAALAGVLTGRVCPGGKLPVQIPRHPGGQPGTYLQPTLGAANTGRAISTPRRCSLSGTARRTPPSR